jgi:hypothetical protein
VKINKSINQNENIEVMKRKQAVEIKTASAESEEGK